MWISRNISSPLIMCWTDDSMTVSRMLVYMFSDLLLNAFYMYAFKSAPGLGELSFP